MDYRLELLCVPVSDVDAAKAFYVDKIGFAVGVDQRVNDDLRFVQLTPPGSRCSICIGEGLTTMTPGTLEGLQLVVVDAVAAHAELLEHGEIFLSEMPFSYPRHASEWIEGIMDLVLVTHAKELWIVDWKTDRQWSSDADDDSFLRRLAEKYGPQLKAYAEVFARGFGRPVSRLLLYSTVLGRLQPVE